MTTWQRIAFMSGQPALSIRAMAAVLAFAAASPLRLPMAPFTSAVTSRIAVTTSACWPGQSFSSVRAAAVKPFLR